MFRSKYTLLHVFQCLWCVGDWKFICAMNRLNTRLVFKSKSIGVMVWVLLLYFININKLQSSTVVCEACSAYISARTGALILYWHNIWYYINIIRMHILYIALSLRRLSISVNILSYVHIGNNHIIIIMVPTFRKYPPLTNRKPTFDFVYNISQ